MFIEVI